MVGRIGQMLIVALFSLLTGVAGYLTPVQAAPGGAGAAPLTVVSGPVSPRVAYSVVRDAGGLTVVIEAERFAANLPAPAAVLAVAAARRVDLAIDRAEPTAGGGRFVFAVPAAKLADADEDWDRLRLGFLVRWPGGPGGADVYRERFLCSDGLPVHAPLPVAARFLAAVDTHDLARAAQDAAATVPLVVNQPLDGKLTVVIDDAAGRRVRNLTSGEDAVKGPRRLEWDGLDDAGLTVPPGAYRWRAISHPGIKPEYQMVFCEGPGSDHNTFCSAVATPAGMAISAESCEGGSALILFDGAGEPVWKAKYAGGTGHSANALACDGDYVYAAHDWSKAYVTAEPKKKGQTASRCYEITLERFAVTNGARVAWGRGGKAGDYRSIVSYDPDVPVNGHEPEMALRGMAAAGGRLYISDWNVDAVLVVNPEEAAVVDRLPLARPGALAAMPDGRCLLAVSAGAVVQLDPGTRGVAPFIAAAPDFAPRALACDARGTVYVSDGTTRTVRVYSGAGRYLRTVGTPGGPYTGAYDPLRFFTPGGLAVASNGWLWVTEPGRWSPKRLVAFDSVSGAVVRERFGRPAYGSPGAGFDPLDPTRWIGQGGLWQVDVGRKTAVLRSVLTTARVDGVHQRFVHEGDRTYVLTKAYPCYGTCRFSLLQEGVLKPVAEYGGVVDHFQHGHRPTPGMQEALDRLGPAPAAGRKGGDPRHALYYVWTDRDGDGVPQAGEFDFSPTNAVLRAPSWGPEYNGFTLVVPVQVDKRSVAVTLAPERFLPGGAPVYPTFARALAGATPLERPVAGGSELTTDRFGRLIVSDSPMTCFTTNGQVRWTYPNQWIGVHGSHKAPLPSVGELQGVLFFTGVAPFDAQADVMALSGNHGRLFFMTTDGLYLDEAFRDVRMGGATRPEDIMGGEAFGGCFGRAETDGTYYLQVGGQGYRIYKVGGFKEAVRQEGALTLTPAQAESAGRLQVERTARAQEVKEATLPVLASPPVLDGLAKDWPAAYAAQWSQGNRFPVKVKAAYDRECLYLYYEVTDSTPWQNEGQDWTLLFKTGDSVDLQLGTDPTAKPARTTPVAGDLRLLIAPFKGHPTAVLYRHRVAGAASPVEFSSPWRTERVDSVTRLAGARIAVKVDADRGYRLEAAIPLAGLGLQPKPETYRGDFGVLYGDGTGQATGLRSYWSNRQTGLVSDVPGEIMLTPSLWGALQFGGEEQEQ